MAKKELILFYQIHGLFEKYIFFFFHMGNLIRFPGTILLFPAPIQHTFQKDFDRQTFQGFQSRTFSIFRLTIKIHKSGGFEFVSIQQGMYRGVTSWKSILFI